MIVFTGSDMGFPSIKTKFQSKQQHYVISAIWLDSLSCLGTILVAVVHNSSDNPLVSDPRSMPMLAQRGNMQQKTLSTMVVCPVCTLSVNMVQLDNKIPEDVQKVFMPMTSLLEDAAQVSRFQQENTSALLHALKQSNQFLSRKAMEYQRKYREAQQLWKNMKLENEQLKRDMQPRGKSPAPMTSMQAGYRPSTATSTRSPASSRLSLRPDSRSGPSHTETNQLIPGRTANVLGEKMLAQQHQHRQQITQCHFQAASVPYQSQFSRHRPATADTRIAPYRPMTSQSHADYSRISHHIQKIDHQLEPSRSMSSFSHIHSRR
ncbi:hypothetical protein BASA50_007454 [Batrachochytrium salamandrivorans]|uniref:Uncharacterized protein n=1 Tax=Batrachochytrium salamandrivorans TaxID=1357716 RepID=A0ABQ8F824_9FUNG|nr:hypothetical protein BASA50_007454 [Batrachochytrium salamandrivorans]